jgi:NADH-quinone oxidoreductase subunit A
MLFNYLPVLMFVIIALVMAVVVIGLGFVLGPRRPDDEKLSPYECGFEAFEDSRMKFDVRYYLVAILLSSSIWKLLSCFPGRLSSTKSACSALRRWRSFSVFW